MLTADGEVPISRDLAMPIGSAVTIDEVTRDDLVVEAGRWPGVQRAAAADVVDEALARIGEVVERAARRVPGLDDAVVETVADRITTLRR